MSAHPTMIVDECACWNVLRAAVLYCFFINYLCLHASAHLWACICSLVSTHLLTCEHASAHLWACICSLVSMTCIVHSSVYTWICSFRICACMYLLNVIVSMCILDSPVHAWICLLMQYRIKSGVNGATAQGGNLEGRNFRMVKL